MKTGREMLNELVAMGYDKEKVLDSIDSAFDDLKGDNGWSKDNKDKEPLVEKIEDDVYTEMIDNIVLGFKCESEAEAEMKEKFDKANLELYYKIIR